MSVGVLGDGELHPGKYNMAIARKAIREKWPITDQIRQLVINQMALVVGKSEDERNRIAASKVLVAADSVNTRREEIETPQQHEHHVHGAVVVEDLRMKILNDRNLLEQLRDIYPTGDGQPGDVCGDGGPAMEVCETPEEAGPSDHGHTNGNGRH